jgi:hypothetical protein
VERAAAGRASCREVEAEEDGWLASILSQY